MSKEDDKKPKGTFSSPKLPGRRVARPVVPAMPNSFDDTVGSAIFDQERSWLKAKIDKTNGDYVIITIGVAVPYVAVTQLPSEAHVWMRDNPGGLEDYEALKYILEAAWGVRTLGSLLLGSRNVSIKDLFSSDGTKVIDRIDRSVAESFANGISLKFDLSDKPAIAELTVRFRRLPGIAEESTLSIKGDQVLNQTMAILGMMLDMTAKATMADLPGVAVLVPGTETQTTKTTPEE